jgi:hypothetical protein
LPLPLDPTTATRSSSVMAKLSRSSRVTPSSTTETSRATMSPLSGAIFSGAGSAGSRPSTLNAVTTCSYFCCESCWIW